MSASALLLTGTVGAGKSATADRIGSCLRAELVPHAVIDLDEIRRYWPTPPDDAFGFEIELRNLKSLVNNYRAAGAVRFVLAGVCESCGDRDRYQTALGSPLVVCRLRAPIAVLENRLRKRHVGDPAAFDWHLRRARELEAILDAADVADVEVDTNLRMVEDVAIETLAVVGWSTGVIDA